MRHALLAKCTKESHRIKGISLLHYFSVLLMWTSVSSCMCAVTRTLSNQAFCDVESGTENGIYIMQKQKFDHGKWLLL